MENGAEEPGENNRNENPSGGWMGAQFHTVQKEIGMDRLVILDVEPMFSSF